MIGKLILILFLSSAGMSYAQESWKKEGIKLPPEVCYASKESHKSFIPPPAEYYERLKSASVKNAIIEVTYIGFPANAQAAFQYAVNIWQTLIDSPVHIRVQATWESLAQGVLGSTSPAAYYHNFDATEKYNVYYPVAIAERMMGQIITPNSGYEIVMSLGKDFPNWYFGTDGNTPSDQYDFASVVLHELTHGLGFTGYFYSQNGRGGYDGGTGDGLPAIFDQYVQNSSGNNLVNTKLFTNPSIKLNQSLTSNYLVFNSQLTQISSPRLYAPSTWDSGSSVYHLDEATYPAGDPNSLMTPFTGMGEAIHDPGPSTLSILYQMGWKSLSIKTTPLKDIEFISGLINFDANIKSDYSLDSTKLFLVYSTNNFATKDSLLLKATAIPTDFNAQLKLKQNGTINYFYSATDVKKRRFVYPSGSPAQALTFTIGVDNQPPVIVYTPIKYLLTSNLSTNISAQVTDNIGVKSVNVEYFVNGGLINTLAMKNDSNAEYSAMLSFPAGSLVDGDLVSYRIVAVDVSSQSNVGRSPVSGYYNFRIVGFHNPVDSYVNNFDQDSLDFISDSFRIYTVKGFDSPALNSPHPYPSPDMDNGSINLTTVLKYPIILKAGGIMSYDEIAIVEPGDPGTKFGDANFYDYVIVEGSSDHGTNWKPLIDGYDSNSQKSWYNLWISSVVGNNSTAVATKDLFVNRQFNMLANGNFKAGDTIQVRFRLFSDPYSHGWGWIVDNLKIQDTGTAVSPVLLSQGEVVIYPNPARGRLNLHIQTKEGIQKLILKAYNSIGEQVYNQAYQVGSNLIESEIDVSKFTPGMYLFTVEPENGQVITRKILIQ
jgi:hypothetical protein